MLATFDLLLPLLTKKKANLGKVAKSKIGIIIDELLPKMRVTMSYFYQYLSN